MLLFAGEAHEQPIAIPSLSLSQNIFYTIEELVLLKGIDKRQQGVDIPLL